jgi:hypothetical protein
MPYTYDDKVIIRHYRQIYGWGSQRILTQLGNDKLWTRPGIQEIINKIDTLDGEIGRLPGSGRPKSARTEENIAAVEEEIFSQEDPETGDKRKHMAIPKIATKLGIGEESVRRIIQRDLNLNMYHRYKCQKLGDNDYEKRLVRGKRLLRTFTREKLSKTFFSDEKIFRVEGPYNPQNDVFYATESKKKYVPEERLLHETSAFPKGVMVFAAVSMKGKTSLYLIEQGIRIDSEYYCEGVLDQAIPEMNALTGSDYIFQQDGARAHTSNHTKDYLAEKLPSTASFLHPDDWPPHSPDLNPMDYGVWSLLQQRLFQVKIRDVSHLCDRLGEIWAEITQDEIDNIIKSFRKRVKACIAAEGHRFEYKM